MWPLRFGSLFESGGVDRASSLGAPGRTIDFVSRAHQSIETAGNVSSVTGETPPPHPSRRVAADGRGPPARTRAIGRTVPRQQHASLTRLATSPTEDQDMKKILATLILIPGALMFMTPASEAAGPFCFAMLPFSNVFVWFIEAAEGNQFVGSGRDLTSGAAQSIGGYVSGTTAHVSATSSPDSSSGFPLLVGASLLISTGTGPGICHRLNNTGGCGTGSAITLTNIACPPSATNSAERHLLTPEALAELG
jgi:hypothetical protein